MANGRQHLLMISPDGYPSLFRCWCTNARLSSCDLCIAPDARLVPACLANTVRHSAPHFEWSSSFSGVKTHSCYIPFFNSPAFFMYIACLCSFLLLFSCVYHAFSAIIHFYALHYALWLSGLALVLSTIRFCGVGTSSRHDVGPCCIGCIAAVSKNIIIKLPIINLKTI